MQVGNATVTIGGGTAILTLPDVPSFVTREGIVAPFAFIEGFRFSDDFDDEIGWNINGSIEAPMGANKTISLNGFWANIEDEHSFTCTENPLDFCTVYPLVDDPAVFQNVFVAVTGDSLVSNAEREVNNWGVSVELKRQLNPGVMGVTQAPPRRYVALGGDIRGIDQDLDVSITATVAGVGPITYNEELDTRYYGAYAAWGGGYAPFLLRGLWERWGLHSSFRLQGGVYFADTDYDGRLNDSTPGPNATSALTLSEHDVAFIGGLTLETKKRIGQRAMLTLQSVYEYYSWVPEMAYNTVEPGAGTTFTPGRQVGTVINDDDALSMRTSLRLTIGLGPREFYGNR